MPRVGRAPSGSGRRRPRPRTSLPDGRRMTPGADGSQSSGAFGAANAPPDEICGTAVACVLLDHVNVDPAQAYRLPAAADECLVELVSRCGRPRSVKLAEKDRVVRLRALRGRGLEVRVWVLLGHVQTVDLLAAEPQPEPGALDLGHVPDQAEQRQVRRRSGLLSKLFGGKAGALMQQRRAVPVKKAVKNGSFATH